MWVSCLVAGNHITLLHSFLMLRAFWCILGTPQYHSSEWWSRICKYQGNWWYREQMRQSTNITLTDTCASLWSSPVILYLIVWRGACLPRLRCFRANYLNTIASDSPSLGIVSPPPTLLCLQFSHSPLTSLTSVSAFPELWTRHIRLYPQQTSSLVFWSSFHYSIWLIDRGTRESLALLYG